jgi:cobaltochelatase CobS
MTTQTVSNVDQRRAARRALLEHTGMPATAVNAMSYAQLSAALVAAGLYLMDDAAPEERRRAHDDEPAHVPAAPSAATVATPSVDTALRAMVTAILSETIVKTEAPAIDMDAIQRHIDAAVAAHVARPVILQIPGLPDRTLPADEHRHAMFDTVLRALAARQHVWLPGPAGSGKSVLARQAFTALGYADPGRGGIHLTGAIETPFQLLGYVSPNGDDRTLYTPFRKAWQNGGAFIFDDTDRSNPKALCAFNEALANRVCAFPDGVLEAHPDFRVAATANTYGLGGGADYVGASRLDAAFLTRFAFLPVNYDEALAIILMMLALVIAVEQGSGWIRRKLI